MKKICIYLFSIVFIFSFNTVLKADCLDEELNEWATTVEPKFVENSGEHALDYFYAYFLTITPMRDDISIEVIDKDGQKANGEKFDLMNLYGVGCYTNISKEKYIIKVYGAENSKCSGELLKTMTYEVLPYNDMIKTEECKQYPEHELCKTFTDKTENMSREDFNKEIKKYEREINKSIFSLEGLLNILKEYGIYILFPFFIISLIYIVKIHKYNKKESKE